MSLPQPTPRQLTAVKSLIFVLGMVPLAHLVWGAWTDGLGANPIEFITRDLGTWTLNFLLLTLCVTPLRVLTGLNWLTRLRRMLGLYAFFYVCLHLTSYLWLDQFFDWPAIAKDIVNRPFITAGFTAFVLLVPLAATSSNAMVRRLGERRWTQLHRTGYAIAILGVLHYWWLAKQGISQPMLYAALLGLLLGCRALARYQRALSQRFVK
ncbi:MAG: sulfoxide reductase heme-binding subunit YedZ [Propionivibrio sp.]|nr:sulfoxide reductase heme-binding subunit YedZ [Propionivibrio sp.]